LNPDLYSPDSPALAAAFPSIQIKDKLGEGGFKLVYKALSDQGTIAFKIIKTHQNRERTLREIMAAARFSSPRFPHIFKYGEGQVATESIVFIVEAFIPGETLRNRLNRGKIEEAEALRIGRELLEALNEVATERLVHRDLKPENIMLTPEGRVILLDFGIARHLLLTSLTLDAAVFGPLTPGYGAPEQIKNNKRAISSKTDLFAWGVVMYEMLAGFNPFTQGIAARNEALDRTLNYDPPSLKNCSLNVSQTIDWCLQKAPHRRPANPLIVRDRL